MGTLKKLTGGMLWLLLASVCFFVPFNAVVRLAATGDLLMISSRHGTAGPVAEPFGRGYFASLGFYIFAGFLGLAFVRTALVDSFGIAGRRFRAAFIGSMLAVFVLFFLLPLVLTAWWELNRP